MNSGSGFLKVWLLALICAVLGYGVYAQSGRQYVNSPAPVSKPGKAGETSSVERFDKFKPLPDIADLSQLIDRPLFSQSRRPGIPQPAPMFHVCTKVSSSNEVCQSSKKTTRKKNCV